MTYDRGPLREIRANHLETLRTWLVDQVIIGVAHSIDQKALELAENFGVDPETARVVIATELRGAAQVFWLAQLAEARHHRVPVSALTEAIDAKALMSVNVHLPDIRSFIDLREQANVENDCATWRPSARPEFAWPIKPDSHRTAHTYR